MQLKPPKLQDRDRVVALWLDDGLAAHQTGDLATAESYYTAILKVAPKHADAIHLLGMLTQARGQDGKAIKLIQTALKHRPDFPLALLNLGNLLFRQQRLEDASACYDQAIAFAPDYAEAWSNRANALRALGRLEDALQSCERAVALRPDAAELQAQLGLALADVGRLEEAIARCERAIASRPGLEIAYLNLFGALYELDRLEEGVRSCDTVLKLKPDFIDALSWRGLFLQQLGRLDAALSDFRAAAALAPENATLQFSLSAASLLAGDFATGWRLHDHRFAKLTPVRRPVDLKAPVWLGEDLTGKRLLIHEEQGLGDIIQFARYLALLPPLGGTVTFLVSPMLHRLLRPIAPGIRFVATQAEVARERFDYQCPLLSLPRAFGTTIETIPATGPYLQADADLVADWQERIGSRGFKIAIAWQGTPDGKVNRGRSPALATYRPLALTPGVRLISVQKGFGIEQLADLPAGMRVETPGADFDSGPDAFVDTAAILATVDLVITSDTSIAHLAGALGRPVWVALKRVPEWRWMLDRTDTPWYPTMTLYRQTTAGDWSDVFRVMAGDVAKLAGNTDLAL